MTKILQESCWRPLNRSGLLWLACLLAAGWSVPAQAQTATETVLHSFAGPPKGALPYAGVIRDSEGNLYGTASAGGAANKGVVFKVDTVGHQTVLYSFTGEADGGQPNAGLIRDAAGNLYGTTVNGGTAGAGVVYKLDPAGHEAVLYSFTGRADGGYPQAGVIRDPAGNLYGTTSSGGIRSSGVVFKVDPTGRETVLYTFTGGTDGSQPGAGVIRDSAGNLYGTTSIGGAVGGGTVYKLDSAGHETVLYSFTGGADGGTPSGVIRDSSGNSYGTATYGGKSSAGVVFKLDTGGNETVLYTFTGGADGGNPRAGVVRDSAGNLYGTTYFGGKANAGLVYKLDPAGGETVLYTFTGGADGGYPTAGVILDSAGNLYGTTTYGGTANLGEVYTLDTAGQETVLHSFLGAAGGNHPNAGVIRDPAGNLYGTARYGGTSNAGVVFKLDTGGNETVLYTFTGGVDGGNPFAGVIRDPAGNLYGTTYSGGKANAGVVYKLDPADHETVLYSFTGGSDGAYPTAGLILDSAGNLYGTTDFGGTTGVGVGVVYKLDTGGQETVQHTFTGFPDGANPQAGVIRDSAGNLYGTTYNGGTTSAGVVYKLDTSGHETVLYSFTGQQDGSGPYAGVVRDSAGNLYGTTTSGGNPGAGVVYKLDTSGQETVLYTFQGWPDGSLPDGGVILDSAGNLYGTTDLGGATQRGTVYKLDTSGHETVLYNFTSGASGQNPGAGVIRDSAGNLYGTTYYGGITGGGVVFKLEPQ